MITNDKEVYFKSKYFQSLHESSVWNRRNITVGVATLSLAGAALYILTQKDIFSFFRPKQSIDQEIKIIKEVRLPVCLIGEEPAALLSDFYPGQNVSATSFVSLHNITETFNTPLGLTKRPRPLTSVVVLGAGFQGFNQLASKVQSFISSYFFDSKPLAALAFIQMCAFKTFLARKNPVRDQGLF